MTMPYTFQLPPMIISGSDAIRELPSQAERLNATRVLLFTDPCFVTSGLADQLATALNAEGITVSVFSDVQPDPTDRNVADGLAALRESRADLVVALGAGMSDPIPLSCISLDAKHLATAWREPDNRAAREAMAADALASGSPQNNPVVPSAADIVMLYRTAWQPKNPRSFALSADNQYRHALRRSR